MGKEFSQPQQLAVNQFNFIPGINGNNLTPGNVFKKLVEQIRQEWDYCYRTQNTKTQKYLNRLKLYNNQKRNDDVVGDTTLFTIHNSVLSALYDDEFTAEFIGRNEGNEDIASNLNAMANYDKDEMKKPQLDYFWDWDTLFFGKGYVELAAFDRKRMCPIPQLLDPMLWQQDPEAQSLNGDMMGYGAARFCGMETLMTKWQLENIPSCFDLDQIKVGKATRSLIDQARQSRQEAQGLDQQIRTEEKELGQNAYFQVCQWRTHYKDDYLTGGQTRKVLVWLTNDRQKVIRFKVLPQQDRWSVVERSLFPSSHDFYGTSLTDLVEDKQRMRAILTNLGINLVKADLFGMYIYDRNHIKTRADLNFDFNKFIGVDLAKGDSIANIVQPMARQNGNQSYFNLIMQILDQSAKAATATPDLMQGRVTPDDKTLGELNKVDQNASKRYSLAANIFGWSEHDFWDQYYWIYKKYFKQNIYEKTVRVQGIFSSKYPVFTREMIIGKTDPDVMIKSKYITQSETNKNRQLLNEYGQIVMQDQTANHRWFNKKMAKVHGLTDEEIEQLYPPTPDELKARQENVQLNDDKFVQVDANDKHMEHLIEHNKGRRTKALLAHVATHMRAMELQKTNPEMFPGLQQQQQQQQGQNQQQAQTMQQNAQRRPMTQQNMQGEQQGIQTQ